MLRNFNPNLNGTPAGKPNGGSPPAPPKGLDIAGAPLRAAEAIYQWFEQNGGRFVVDDRERTLLHFEGALYRIAVDDRAFNALMQQRVGIIHAEPGAAAVWMGLAVLCRQKGARIGAVSWTRTDLEAGTLAIHLHDPQNRILQLAAKPEMLPPGTGPVLRPLRYMAPIGFDPQATARDSVTQLRDLVADALPVHPNQRWMVVSWLLTAFFLDHPYWHRSKPLLIFNGPTCSGKSVALRLMTSLLYGSDRLLTGEADVLAIDAQRRPFLALELFSAGDQVNLPLGGFLLGVSKGEGLGAEGRQLALTAAADIEPFYRPELIRWSCQIECRKRYHRPDYCGKAQCERIAEARSGILSGIFELFSREVVPGLEERHREAFERLCREHPQHPKQPADVFLALMSVILRALFSELHEDSGRADFEARRLVDEWVEDQGRIQQLALREVSPTVELMSHLAVRMAAGVEDISREYLLDCERESDSEGRTTAVRFEAGARLLLIGLTTLASKLGRKQPYPTPRHLAIRLEAESALLKDDGWQWGKSRVVHGEQLYRFRKEVV